VLHDEADDLKQETDWQGHVRGRAMRTKYNIHVAC